MLLLSTAASGIASATPTPRIGVLLMQPGEIFFERFGHNAIVVDDPGMAEPVSYNYGYFDPTVPGFAGRFALGDMRYFLVAIPLSHDLAYYEDVGRGVSVQWLDLDPGQAAKLAAALAVNALPENAEYQYDYFTDNCSTRVRDALDEALDGELRLQLTGVSAGNTYRSEAIRLASPTPWMWLGFDIGLGPAADRRNSIWDDLFIPMRLTDVLRSFRHPDGRPLVAGEQELLPHRLPPEPTAGRLHWTVWLAVGLLLATILAVPARSHPHRVARLAIPFWLVAGLTGLVLLFLWTGTEHRFAWANRNLLLFNPLCLLLAAGAWSPATGRPCAGWFKVLSAIVATLAVFALLVHGLPVAYQDNARWIALLMPIHVALAAAFWRYPAAPPHVRIQHPKRQQG